EMDEAEVEKCVARDVTWHATNHVFVPYQARVGEAVWALMMGEFPVEDMWMLFIDGEAIGTFNNWPAAWTKIETPQRKLIGAGLIVGQSEDWFADWIENVAQWALER